MCYHLSTQGLDAYGPSDPSVYEGSCSPSNGSTQKNTNYYRLYKQQQIEIVEYCSYVHTPKITLKEFFLFSPSFFLNTFDA